MFPLSDVSCEKASFAVADFDGNGLGDVAFATSSSSGWQIGVALAVSRGVFASPVLIHLAPRPTYPGVHPVVDLAVGDFDGDGLLDLATFNRALAPPLFAGLSPNAQSLCLFLGTGGGFFAPPLTLEHAGTSLETELAAGDLDLDGLTDLVVAGGPNEEAKVLLTRWHQGGDYQPWVFDVGSSSTAVALFDFDLDGDLDLALPDAVHRNDGQGRFDTMPNVPLTTPVLGLCAADVNDDGYPDLITSASTQLRIMLNQGGSALTLAETHTLPQATGPSPGDLLMSEVDAADVDGDGFMDILVTPAGNVSNSDRSLRLLMGSATGFSTEVDRWFRLGMGGLVPLLASGAPAVQATYDPDHRYARGRFVVLEAGERPDIVAGWEAGTASSPEWTSIQFFNNCLPLPPGPYTLTISQTGGSGAIEVGVTGLPGEWYFTVFTMDPQNATAPGVGWWGGLHISVPEVVAYFGTHVPLVRGVLPAGGSVVSVIPAGILPSVLPPVYGVTHFFDPSWSTMTGRSGVAAIIPQ